MNENLQSNPFFAALLDHIPNLEKNCSKENWILCIPQLVSLPESHRISLKLLKAHVLIPSSKQSNEYNSLNGNLVRRIHEKELEVEELNSKSESKRVVSILYKEVIYSQIKGEESYSAFCVSRPLEGGGQVPMFEDGTEVFQDDREAIEWEKILFNREEKRKELEKLEYQISNLENPLKKVPISKKNLSNTEPIGYSLCRILAEKMCLENTEEYFEQAKTNSKFKILLQTGYETCIAMNVHGIIFAALSQEYCIAENDIQTRLHDLRTVILMNHGHVDKTGLTKNFLDKFRNITTESVSFQAAIESLQKINEKKTPLEKLWCLKEVSRNLREIKENTNMDDALPLFLFCLIHAAPGLLLSNLYYMTDFAPRSFVKSAGELAFYCTVFQGAVSIIQEHCPIVQEEEESLLKNLIVAGGSGLGVSWISGANGKVRSNNNKDSSAIKPFQWFESCTPQSRRE